MLPEPVTLTRPLSEIIGVMREALQQGNSVQFCATGSSMRPFLQDNDLVLIAPLSSRLRIGDIVLAEVEPGKFVMHRIYSQHHGIILLGDACWSFEGPVKESAIVGRITAVWRSGKWRSLERGPRRYLAIVWLFLFPLRFFLMRLRRKLTQLREGFFSPSIQPPRRRQ